MRRFIVFISGLCLFFPLSAYSSSLSSAKKNYNFYCAQCHGMEGLGDGPNATKDMPVTPRDFTNATEMSKLSDADLKKVISDGGPAISKSALMPPWSKTLGSKEIDELVKYLRMLCNCKGK